MLYEEEKLLGMDDNVFDYRSMDYEATDRAEAAIRMVGRMTPPVAFEEPFRTGMDDIDETETEEEDDQQVNK